MWRERLAGLEDEVKTVGSHTEEERFLGLSGEVACGQEVRVWAKETPGL